MGRLKMKESTAQSDAKPVVFHLIVVPQKGENMSAIGALCGLCFQSRNTGGPELRPRCGFRHRFSDILLNDLSVAGTAGQVHLRIQFASRLCVWRCQRKSGRVRSRMHWQWHMVGVFAKTADRDSCCALGRCKPSKSWSLSAHYCKIISTYGTSTAH